MVKLCLAIIVFCSVTACNFAGKTASSQPDSAAKEPSAKNLAVGDSAVFKFSIQGYVEGKIQSIDGTRYKMLYGQSTQTADAVDVYALPKMGAKVDLKPGDIVVAYRRDAYWPGAEVKSADGDVIQVQVISDGDSLNVPNEKVIKINAAAAAEFKQYAQEVAFLKAAKDGRPHPPAGYKPKVGERVVAEWTDKTWYLGDVISASSRTVKIKWPASFPESELVLEKVLPYPAPNATPAVNDFLVVKPERETSAYVCGQVTNVNGGTVEVKLADGKTRIARQGDFYLVN